MPETSAQRAARTAAASKKLEKNFAASIAAHPGWPKVISEGDSWFSFPFRWNLIDYVDRMGDFSLLRMETSGDTVRHVLGPSNRRRLARVLTVYPVDVLLVSAGGNDVLGKQALLPLLLDRNAAGSWAGVLDGAAVAARVARLELAFRELAALRDTYRPGCVIVVHGYDYPVPGKRPVKVAGVPLLGPWLLPALLARHVTDPDEQRRIVRALVDRFNELLDRLARELHGWRYVDLRRTLADGDWGDEIHPKAKGFAALAEKFRPVLQNLCPGNFRRRVELG